MLDLIHKYEQALAFCHYITAQKPPDSIIQRTLGKADALRQVVGDLRHLADMPPLDESRLQLDIP